MQRSSTPDLLHSFLVSSPPHQTSCFFFFNDTATTEIYTLSLHDALPILPAAPPAASRRARAAAAPAPTRKTARNRSSAARSEEHTSELQSPDHLVCRLLLEKKKKSLYRKPTARPASQDPDVSCDNRSRRS